MPNLLPHEDLHLASAPMIGRPRQAAGRKGLLFLLSGPSGCGKSNLARLLLRRHGGPGRSLERSVSVTTQPPRSGEVDGSDYRFLSAEAFAGMLLQGDLLETAELYGHWYGTPRAFVEERLGRGLDVLLVLDAQGRQQLARTHAADLVSVFLLPPSSEELELRLRGRNQDDEATIVRRLEAARQEIARCGEYDHVLVNRDLTLTLDAIDSIFGSARRRRP